MQSKRYALIDGRYVLHEQGHPAGPALDEVAVAFVVDQREFILLHRHGVPAAIDEWVHSTRAKLCRAGERGSQVAARLEVVQGRFDLADLNGSLDGSQSALRRLICSGAPRDIPMSAANEVPAGPAQLAA